MRQKGDLTRLMVTVAARQDEELARRDVVTAARERLFVGGPVAVRRGASPGRGWVVALAAAAALMAVAVLFLRARTPDASALRFDVGGVPGTRDVWMGAAPTTPLPITFSNGASVVLAAESRARVTAVSAHGAAVELARGRLTVAVPHQPGTDWRFDAGPYDVKVIGTRFEVAWDEGDQTFELDLIEGAVEVRGPRIDGVRRVMAGETLTLRLPANPAPGVPSASTAVAGSPSVAPEAPAPLTVPARRISPALPSPSPSPDWASLARQGSYREAFAVAEKRGFDAEVARATPSDLLLLGDASRYAGNPSRARQCYLAVRTKFGGSLEASRASFRLGVLAFPATSALPLFEAFLTEQPNDPLASEALGRILEIDDNAGDVESAKAVSERYLAKYPDGAHARLARGILGR